MHVVLVAVYPLPGNSAIGGVERVVQILRHELSRCARVTLVVPNAEANLDYQDHLGTIYYLKRSFVPPVLSYWTLASRSLHQKLSMLDADIVHVHGAAGLAFTWTKPVEGQPPQFIFTAHGVAEKDVLHARNSGLLRQATKLIRAWIYRQVECAARQRFNRIIVINDYVLNAFPDVKKLRWRSIPNPVDQVFLEDTRGTRLPKRASQLLQVGSVEPRKNNMGAIELLRCLVNDGIDVHLNVVGPITDRRYHDRCRENARALGLENSVTFHGPADPAKLASWMDSADALLLTSKQETAPMVVAEAHCRGLPCAVPRAFGLVSMVQEGINGVFLDGDTPTTQAARIWSLLERPLKRDAIRREARAKYSPSSVINQTMAVYSEALNATHSQRTAQLEKNELLET